MRLRTFTYLAVTTIVLSTVLIFIAFMPKLLHSRKQEILSYNDVRGMAIERQGLLYTLNFEQQNRMVAAINHNDPIKNKLIIYRFNHPDWVIEPRE